MSGNTFSAGGAADADSLLLLGADGAGYIELPQQSSMAPAAAGSTRVFTSAGGDFSFMDSAASAASLSCDGLTAPRTYTFPDVSDEIVSRTAPQTLTGKTIMAAGGNVVDATSINGFEISGTPTTGQYLKYGGSQWSPQTISATSPVSFTGDTISVAVGVVGGLTSFTDPRLTSPQVINVRTGTVGHGEYNSIALALASVTDATTLKRYMISVGTGIFVEPPMTLKPFVYIKGFNKISTIVRPSTPGTTLFTATSYSSLEEMMVYGLGTGIGIDVDSCIQCYFGNLTARNFHTLMRFAALTAPTDTLLHEFIYDAPCTYGILVDGTVASSAFIANISLSMGRVRCDGSTTNGLRFVGPNAKVGANSVRAVGASTGVGCYIDDAANVELGNSKITDCAVGLHVANVGGGPVCYIRDILFLNNTSLDVNIAHPASSGLVDGIANRNKVTLDPSSALAVSYVDLESHANIITGEFFYAPSNDTVLTETGSLIVNSAAVGCYAGGTVNPGLGLAAFVDSGLGYIVATSPSNVDYMLKVTWPSSSVAISDNTDNYIYVNSAGLQYASSVPSQFNNILLARVRTRNGSVEFVDSQLQSNLHPSTRNIIAKRETGVAIYASGSTVVVTGGNQINVTAGVYYYLNNRFAPVGGLPIAYKAYWRDGGGDWTIGTENTIVPLWDDNSGTLQAIPVAKWARSLLYLVCDGTAPEIYLYVYGQALFDSETAAANDTTTMPPSYFTEGVTAIASFTIDSAGVATARDLRSIRSNTGNGAIATVVAHGALTGLGNDDHLQYLLVNGTRAMTGSLNMGTFAVTNAGTYNGVTVEAHAARHLPNGADPLSTAAPLSSLTSLSTNAVGTANSLARSDHSHAVDISGFSINSLGGTLGVAKGGTGATTLTANGVLVGNGVGVVDTTKAAPTGAFVGTTDTQTLTNKTLQASTTAILGNSVGAGTGTVRFVANGASSTTFVTSAAAAINLTTPTASDTLVGRATTDTLTNKSITGGAGGNTVAANLIRGVTVSATPPTAGQALVASDATNASWAGLASLAGTLTVAQGGTGLTTLTNGRVLVGAGAALDLTKAAPVGAFVGDTDTQTLSNKTLTAASTTIRGTTVGDTLTFTPTGVTSIVTNGAATLTMPAGTRTIADTDSTQTFTNKTLLDPSNDISAGKIRNVSGVVSTLGASAPSTGQILTATSATTATWQTPSAATNVSDATFVIEDSTVPSKTIRFDAGGTASTGTTIVCTQTANRSIALPDATTTLVGTDTTQTLTNKTLTTPVIAQISNSGTLTLPSTTDTLVARATTDTLSNKTLSAATTAIAGTGVVEFTAGGTSTCTFATAPSADIVLTFPSATDTVTGNATAATLSNKILDMATTLIRDATNTRDVVFEATGIASTELTLTSALTANRVLTFPDITDTLVTKTSIDTFANKTIVGNDSTQIVDADRVRGTKVGAIAPLPGQVLTAFDTLNATWETPSVNVVEGYLDVANGGTGTTALTAGRVLIGDGINAVNLDKAAPSGDFVGDTDAQTLTNKTLTLPVIAQITNTGTLTLPSATTTLVGRDTTDTLTNKTLSYTTSTIDVNRVTGVTVSGTPVAGNGIYASSASAAAWGALDLSTAAATTGTLGVGRGGTGATTLTSGNLLTGNGTGAILSATAVPAGGLVGVTATQTLSGKTLTAASTTIEGAANAIDLLTFTPVDANSVVFTGASTVTMPTGTRTLVGRDTTDTLTNKTINDATNTVAASRLRYIGGSLSINATSAPVAGQALIATSSTNAIWQDITATSQFGDSSFQIFRTGDPTNTVSFALLGTTGTGTQIIANQTGNITIDLPSITTTLVGTNTTNTLTNKTLTLPVIASISNGGTLTLPTATDTLVARATTDTFTNKTIVSTTNTVAAQQLHNATGTVSVSASAAPAAGQTLVASSSTVAAWATPSVTTVTGTLPVANGGTGATTLTSGNVLVGAGVSAVTTTKAAPTGAFVGDTDTQTLTNKTLTLPVIASITNGGTITLPSGTHTLVGRTTVDTLTNKTLTTPIIASISNVGTLTLPASTDTLVARATTDTFTNKTIVSTTNTVAAQQLHNTTGVVTVSASAAPTAGQTLVASSATTAAWGNLSISDVSGNLLVANGGTGLTTLTTGRVLIGAGTSPVDLTKAAPTGDFVGTTDTQTLSGKTLTLPVISTISNGGVLTLPTGPQTLVGRTTTDTLTNKTLTQPVIDTIFNVDVLTLPTGPDTLVGRNSADTLLNKTLVTPAISTIINTGILTLPTVTTTLVGRTTVDTLTNKTLTAPIIASISNTGTLTLPTSTDTLVARATTDTFTNKTIVSTTNTVAAQQLHNATGVVTVSASAAPTAGQTLVASSATVAAWGGVSVSTVTGTLPVANGGTGVTTLTSGNVLVGAGVGAVVTTKAAPAGAFVGDTDTQTLTNKTLTTPVIAQITNTGTLTLPTATDTLVGRATTDTLTNKTLTLPVIASISNAGTITLPTGTRTLVARDTTDTLTNKTLTTPIIAQISNTGTLTLPTATDTLVGRATTDTLTNKTITDTTNTVAAKQLVTATGVVSVNASAAPTAGQALVASSATVAAWASLARPLTSSSFLATATAVAQTNVTGNNAASSFTFPGTTAFGTITRFSLTASLSVATSYNVRLQDVTNGLTIATITVNVIAATLYTTTTIANVPAGPAELQVQASRTGGASTFTIRGWTIVF